MNLKIVKQVPLPKVSEQLQNLKLYARSNGSKQDAMISAAWYAKKYNKQYAIYPGNSFGSAVWRVSDKPNDYLNPVNNDGNVIYLVNPDLTVFQCDLNRKPFKAAGSAEDLDKTTAFTRFITPKVRELLNDLGPKPDRQTALSLAHKLAEGIDWNLKLPPAPAPDPFSKWIVDHVATELNNRFESLAAFIMVMLDRSGLRDLAKSVMYQAVHAHPGFYRNARRKNMNRTASFDSQRGLGGQNNHIRWHVYTHAVKVTDLTNAGKRGKTCRELSLYDIDFVKDPAVMKKIDAWVDRLRMSNYDQVLERTLEILEGAQSYPKLTERLLKAITVAPVGQPKLSILTPNLSIRADGRSFSVRDLRDKANASSLMDPVSNGVRASQAFYAWLVANREAVESMTFMQLERALDQSGIKYHFWYGMD